MGKKLVKIEQNGNKTLTDVFNQFVKFKKASGISDRTIKLYYYEFEQFIKQSKDSKDLNVLKQEMLELFARKSQQSNATYNYTYKVFNCLFNWAEDEEIISKNPIKAMKLKSKRDEYVEKNIPTVKIKEMLKTINPKIYVEFRDYVIILLMLDTGIRPNEAFSLELADIDLSYSIVKVTKEKAKTRTERQLPISKIVVDCIRKIIKIKPNDWKLNYVFNTYQGNQMNTNMFTRRLQEYSNRCGYKITPYDLRHIFATKFIENGGNIFTLQRMMGHSDLRMTKRYVSISKEQMEIQHTKATPLNDIVMRNTIIKKTSR